MDIYKKKKPHLFEVSALELHPESLTRVYTSLWSFLS